MLNTASSSNLCLPGDYSSLASLLHHRAKCQPEQIGYRFLPEQVGAFDADATIELSYGSLMLCAQQVAQQLEDEGCEGQPVLLLYPSGLDFVAAFFGCVLAGAIAVPIYPPRRNQKLVRIQSILADSGARHVMATEAIVSDFKQKWQAQFGHASLKFVATAEVCSPACAGSSSESFDRSHDRAISDLEASFEQVTQVNEDSVALLQYTSGSTGQPKGVAISHGNLLHNLGVICQKFGHSAESHGVIWLPPHHDMGLVGGVLQPLYSGFPVVLMSPMSFLRQPLRWLQAISYYRATISGGPNFAFERCLQRITPEQRQDLDLSCWKVAFTGAEPVRAQTLRHFSEAFSDCGFEASTFYPCYGLAEFTLIASGGDYLAKPVILEKVDSQVATESLDGNAQGAAAVKELVGCGQPPVGHQLKIVDPQSCSLCVDGDVGEIWLAGPSVAQGYWQQPEQTEAIFQAHLDNGEGPFLRTGDLGFVQHGELFVTGRIKDLIVIRGQNIYPQDIEQTIESVHEWLNPQATAAFGLDIDDAEQLVIVQELTRAGVRAIRLESEKASAASADAIAPGPIATEIIGAIRTAVSQAHSLQVHAICLIKTGSILKTSSGKIQRSACKAAFERGELNTIALSQISSDSSAPKSLPQPVAAGEPLSANLSSTVSSNQDVGSQQIASDRIAWLRDYANHHINSQLIDERRCIPPSIVLDFGNQGLLGMQVPQSFGGLELGHRDTLRILEQLGAIDPTLSLFVGLNNVLGIRPILQSAQPELRDELLPLLATGRELAAFALTEPSAGSNPSAMQSTATPMGRRWLLNGQKIWSGSAAWAGVTNVFVQQQNEAGQALGVSGFVLRRGTPGLRQGPEALTMGMRGMVQNQIFLEDAVATDAERLGEPGRGMTVAQDAMQYGRLAIAAASIGGMKRCAQLLLRYGDRRMVATGRLLNNPAILLRLSEMTAAIAALEALVKTVAQRLDLNQSVPVELYTVCKILAPEFYWKAADDLVQCLGGRGYIETNMAPQILRDARVLRIFEGPTETLAMFLGSQMMGENQGLVRFIQEELQSPEIAKALTNAVVKVVEQFTPPSLAMAHSPWTDSRFPRQQSALLIGQLTASAILWAVISQACLVSDATSEQMRSLAWAKEKFEQQLVQTLVISPAANAARATENLSAIVETYQQTVGDVEQTLAGEDRTQDILLEKSPQKSPSVSHQEKDLNSESPLREIVPKQVANSLNTQKNQALSPKSSEIQQWLIHWVSRQLKIAEERIEPSRAFAEYGLDSVMAVELAQDLETSFELANVLDPTLAWNFPTIEKLSSYISLEIQSLEEDQGKTISSLLEVVNCSEKNVLKDSKDSLIVPVDSEKFIEDDDLDSLSESDLAELLAAELSTNLVGSGRRQE